MDRRSSGSDETPSSKPGIPRQKSGDLQSKGENSDWHANGLKAVSTVAGAINSLFKRSSTSVEKELVFSIGHPFT